MMLRSSRSWEGKTAIAQSNVPGIHEQAEFGQVLCGTIDSFLIWKFTGGPSGGLHVTDVTNASRTQLMDLATAQWEESILSDFEIPAQMLPKIVSSSEVFGHATIAAIEGVAIAGVLGDQQAALVGQTCFKTGEAKNTYGTGCFMLMNTGTRPVRSKCGLLTTVAYRLGAKPTHYALEGSIAITGALVVRLALVTSVTCSPPLGPPVNFQIRKLSMVPQRTCPNSACS